MARKKAEDYVSRGRAALEDDSSTALDLSHRAQDGTPVDRKGRAVVRLPDATPGYRADLVGKTPEQIAEMLASEDADRDADEHVDFDRMMREVPGGSTGAHSSSGGRRNRKPNPPPDFTGQGYGEPEAPAKYRPHQVGGRVSTRARHGLLAQKVSIGEMLDLLGETLNAGVSWVQIEFTVKGLSDRSASAQSGKALSFGKVRR